MIFQAIGVVAAGLAMLSYWLLVTGRIEANSISYLGLNVVIASCMFCSLIKEFNLATFVMQVFFMSVSLYGLAKILLTRNRIDTIG